MDAQMNTASGDLTKFKLMEEEDQLDLELSPVDPQIAEREIEACNEHLQLNGNPINHGIATIPLSALLVLYTEAMALRQDTLNFVTGVKMHLAVREGSVSLIFQPVLMTRQPSVMGEPFYNVTGGAFYTYDSVLQTFQVYPERQAHGLMTFYRNDIRIKHRIDNDFTEFIPNLDTEAIIFPFQTIVALAKDNESNAIFFHNSVRFEPVGGGYSVKHCLLLSSAMLQGNGFKGMYANRSHLCPPSCNIVQYALLV